MRQDYSRTAEGMAMLRALEQQQPPAQRIIDDPYAQHFLFHRVYRWLATWRFTNAMLRAFIRWWAPGGLELLTIRPRLVDDLTVESVKQGVAQIVLLGAGFDTFAWRRQSELSGVTIFEVDHPATQVAKRSASERLGVPSNLNFVAVDFETEDFVEKLRQAGFDAQRPSFIIWVGVSYYLTPAAVAQTLTRIAAISQPGTKLVWDYLLQEILDGISPNKEALDKARRVAQLGEPWLFGLATEQIGQFLAPFGLRLCKDYSAKELHQQYCPQRQMPMSYVRIVVCERVTSFTLPNATRAVVELEKLRDYCLNPNHPRGKHKARVFQAALGLQQEDAERLQEALRQAARTQPANKTEADQYGQRYVVTFRMQTDDGDAVILSSWIVLAHEDFPRLTSCYVIKDGGEIL